jgi:adenylate cyclase
MLRAILRIIKRSPTLLHSTIGVLFVCALALELFGLRLLNTTEHRLTDMFMRHHAPEFQVDPNIVEIDIDDQSLVKMEQMAGLWAWPREIHADLLDALAEFSPRAVVFDLAFPERDQRHPKSDARLTESLQAFGPRVYLAATQLLESRNAQPTLLREVQTAFGVRHSGPPQAQADLLLPNAIDPKVWQLGLDNSTLDGDGILRRYYLQKTIHGWTLPSLPARVAADLGAHLPSGGDFLICWPGARRVRYSYGEFYRTLTEDRPGMAAQDVRKLDSIIRDKIIVIGSSATSTFDHHLTPMEKVTPGVDVLATALDNLINANYMRTVPSIAPFLFGALLIACLVAAFSRRINPLTVSFILIAITAVCLAVADQAIGRRWMLPLVTPLIFAWTWFLLAAIAGYLRERRTREQAVSLFRRFLNPEVVRQIVDKGETVESMSGRASEITVLFSDIRGFTTLSETHPPQQVVALLNRYFDRQVEVVFRHGGTLDKFIGDCIMAFWGAPLADPAHAGHAVAAALEMQENLLNFRHELIAENSDMADFDVGIGVHTGPAVVGFIGARRKLDYTAIGDTVNLASRIEGLTKGVARVLVSRETVLACGQSASIDFELRGAYPVKGRSAEVELYEPKRKTA